MEEVKSKSCIETESSSPYPKWCGVAYEEIVCSMSFILGILQMQLPTEKIDGYPVPTIIFKGQPKTYHSFLMGIILSLCSAVTAVYIRDPKPMWARYYRQFSVLAMATTLLILFWAATRDVQIPGFCHWK